MTYGEAIQIGIDCIEKVANLDCTSDTLDELSIAEVLLNNMLSDEFKEKLKNA